MRTIAIASAFLTLAFAQKEPPDSWIDPITGHRVIRLTRERGSSSLEAYQNWFTAGGRRLVYTLPNGIAVLDLEAKRKSQVVNGPAIPAGAGRASQRIYYTKGNSAYWTDAELGETKEIAALPPHATVSAVNFNERLLAGTYPEGDSASVIFTLNVKTGEMRIIHRENVRLSHLSFSPADPDLLMFREPGGGGQEGHTRLIRTDRPAARVNVHPGAAFWGADGRTVWYGSPGAHGSGLLLTGYGAGASKPESLRVEAGEWPLQLNISPAGSAFCAGGGRSIYLFHSAGKGRSGAMLSERLADLDRHDPRLDPAATFSPDRKWVIFRSNMFDDTYVFAVEVERAVK